MVAEQGRSTGSTAVVAETMHSTDSNVDKASTVSQTDQRQGISVNVKEATVPGETSATIATCRVTIGTVSDVQSREERPRDSSKDRREDLRGEFNAVTNLMNDSVDDKTEKVIVIDGIVDCAPGRGRGLVDVAHRESARCNRQFRQEGEGIDLALSWHTSYSIKVQYA